MRIELSLFILLCVTLSCNGLREKIVDPAIVNGEYPDGQYSSVYRGSSSASYSYGGSIGEAGNDFGVPPQTNNNQRITKGYVGKSQLHNNGELQDYGYGGVPQETSLGNYQQSNGFIEGRGYDSRVPQTGNLGLTLNINLGKLIGSGRYRDSHSHHHGHKHHHKQGNFHDDFYNRNVPNVNINGHRQFYNINGECHRPEHYEYQYHDDQYFNHNVGYNKPEHIGNQNDHIYHEPTYVTQQPEESIYKTEKNTNLSGLSSDNLPQIPTQNDKYETPDDNDDQNENKNIYLEPTELTPTEFFYISTTENTKTPYENEKNSKITTSNRKTTSIPESDRPLLVPLNANEYTYEGDKIQIISPKRNADKNKKKEEINTKEEEFDIDVRFNDDE